MGGISSAIQTALSALAAQQAAFDVTANNVANVNTPGYARRRVVLQERVLGTSDSLVLGGGVMLAGIQSMRDEMLELRMNTEAQRQGAAEIYVKTMSQLTQLFSDTSDGIGRKIGAFFDSINKLQTAPASDALRQAVLGSAEALTQSVRTAASQLTQMRSDLDYGVNQSVSSINSLTAAIAQLNSEIARVKKLGGDCGSFEDQRTQALRSLAKIVDISVVQADDGVTLTTSRGTTLVVGNRSYGLQTAPDPSGHLRVMSGEADITAEINSGQLGAMIDMRDNRIPAALAQLDTLVAGLTAAVNTAHRQGYDLNGAAGEDFFVPPAATAGCASTFRLAITDTTKVAASSDGFSGSGGNLPKIVAVRDTAVASGKSPIDFYSSMVFGLGDDLAHAKAEVQASDLVMQQLETQRGAVSGVSLDEEAANMMRLQRAYEAAARVFTTADEMIQIALEMGRR